MPIAFWTSLIFVAHPIHTEVVANIKGADELWAALWALMTLLIAMRYQSTGGIIGLLGTMVTLGLGLLSKEHVITFLAIVPLTLWYARPNNLVRSSSIRQLNTFLAMFAIAAGYIIYRIGVIGWTIGELSTELMNNPFLKYESGRLVPFSLSEHIASVAYGLYYDLRLLLIPHPLVHDYYPRQFDLIQWWHPLSLVGIICSAFFLGFGLFGMARRSIRAYAALFYCLSLSVTSNTFFPIGTHLSERFLFIPSIAFCLFIVWSLMDSRFDVKRFIIPFLAAYTVVLVILTVWRTPVWHDNFSLFMTDVETSSRSAKLQNAAAGVLLDKYGRLSFEEAKPYLIKALNHVDTALAIHPLYKNAHLIRGNALNLLRRYDEALLSYEKVLEFDPDNTDARNNLFLTYRTGARYAGEQHNDLNKAIAWLEKAQSLRPDDRETQRLIGVAYGKAERYEDALKIFLKLSELYPNESTYFDLLATTYHMLGDTIHRDEAKEYARQIEKQQ